EHLLQQEETVGQRPRAYPNYRPQPQPSEGREKIVKRLDNGLVYPFMHTFFRRDVLPWLGFAALLGTLLSPSVASADPLTSWTAGPDAVGDNTYAGFIDIPPMNATVPNGGFTVAGWFVDQTAQGWAGADDIQVWQGTMDGGGKMLAKATIAQSRPDVATALGNPFWEASGFGGLVP